jgi:hypothetical protein
MLGHVLSFATLSAIMTTLVTAQTKLTDHRYHYPDQIPYKVDTDATGRGPQYGFTQCNSTTQGQSSNCQLAMLNAIDDFCLWGPPDPNSLIGNEEAETVAWCTKPGHGTRVIPGGTLTGVQFLKAPSYILVAGTLNQGNVNIDPTDTGGEMDPHGADERGNPLGGLVYTNGFPSNGGNNNSFQQVIEWHNFMGSGQFCFKICDPSIADSKPFCNNIYDMTGCSFVAPASYQTDVFEMCESENMDPVGIYTGSDGKTSTYSQPAVVTSLPSVRTPASSNCVTYTSSVIYAAGATIGVNGTTTGTSTGTGSSPTGTGIKTTTTPHSSGSTPKGTSTSTTSNAAGARVDLGVAIGFGPLIAVGASVLASLGAVLVGL